MAKSVMEKINETIGKINYRYDMGGIEITEIYENSQNPYDMITNGFRYGYIKGAKSERAKAKKETLVEFTQERLKMSKDVLKYATDEEIRSLRQICGNIIERRKAAGVKKAEN